MSESPGIFAQVAATQSKKRSRSFGIPSDVVRFRGMLWGSVVCVVALLGALVATLGFERLRSPGPLSKSHTRAGIECEKCHDGAVGAGSSSSSACIGCHAEKPSERSGHAALRAAGRLTCTTCHVAHAPLEIELERSQVPLLPAARCASCHAIDEPTDLSFACLSPIGEGRRVNLCFDEHQAVGESRRDAAWERARAAALASPVREPDSRFASLLPFGWLALGLGFGGIGLVLARRIAARGATRSRGARGRPDSPAPSAPLSAEVRLPVIDPSRCLGCYACVDACPYDVISVRRYVAVVERPDLCCGLTLCEQRCPNGSLVMSIEGERVHDGPRVQANLESADVPGLYLAGDLTGLPLIRNAIDQGAQVAQSIAALTKGEKSSRPRAPKVHDLVVIGTGPAGLSATLTAKQLGLDVVALERGTLAHSIRSFPREKLVLDYGPDEQPPDSLWLDSCTKEVLLAEWQRTAREHELPILEGRRVLEIRRDAGFDGFEVLAELLGDTPTAELEAHRARRVLLAIGRRGTPRRLEAKVAAAAEPKVHYHLADARTFAGQRVVIYGLGDVAMEAALALAHQQNTRVTICYRGSEFKRGRARTIAELKRVVERGRVKLSFGTTITAVGASELELVGPAGPERLPYDALLVMIGTQPPWQFLESVGIRRGPSK
jgi:thioredoxin reductase